MGNDYTRSQYLQALLNQKNTINASGGSLLNPSIPNASDNLDELATINTNASGIKNDIAQYDPEKEVNDDNWFINGMNKIFGFVDEIAAKFGAGFVGAFEGVFDFGATAIGALGDWTGLWDSDPFTKWAEQDIATQAAEWTKTYANLTPWGIISNIANGNYASEQYWQDAFKGAGDILGSALFFDNEVGNYRQDADKYYQFNDDLETGFGEFLGGAAYSIGFMLPSIFTGGFAGKLGASSKLAKGLSLGSMGLSAAGKGSEETLKEGATAGQALATGAAKGAVEVVSEIVVGKALKKAATALHLDKIVGGFDKVNGVSMSKELVKKASAKELAATMFEEGAEEVFSDVLAPITEVFYKGSDSFKQYGESDYWKQMGLSFLSGAFVGGLSSGFQSSVLKSKYGSNGVQVLQNNQEILDLREEYKQAKIEGKDTTEIETKFKTLLEDTVNQLGDMASSTNNKTKKQFRALMDGYFGKTKVKGINAEAVQNLYTERMESFKNEITKPMYKSMTDDIAKSFSKKGVNLDIQWVSEEEMKKGDFSKYGISNKVDTGTNSRAFIKTSTGKIIVNEKYQDAVGEIIKHEALSHAILDSDTSIRDSLIKFIENDKTLSKELHKFDKQIKEEYGENENTLTSERLATFIENQLKDYKKFSSIFSTNSLTKSKMISLLNRFNDKITKSNSVDTQIINSLNKAITTLKETQIKSSKADTQYTTKPEFVYSKDIKFTELEDSNGDELSTEMAKWLNGTKFVDEDNRPLVLYHGSNSAGFMEFSKHRDAIFLTDDWDRAASYTYTGNLVNTKTFDNAKEVIDYINSYEFDEDISLVDGTSVQATRIADSDEAQNYITKRIGVIDKANKNGELDDLRKRETNLLNSKDSYALVFYKNGNEDGVVTFENEESFVKEALPSIQVNNNIAYQQEYDLNEENGYLYEGDNDEDFMQEQSNNVYSLYAKVKNPLIIDCKDNNFMRVPYKGKFMRTDDIAKQVRKEGIYDGIIFKDILDNGNRDYFNEIGIGNVYVVFKGNQLKALDNYNPTESDDIRYSKNIKGDLYGKNNDLGRLLKRNSKDNKQSTYIGSTSSDIWQKANDTDAREILERLLPKEDIAKPSSRGLDVIQWTNKETGEILSYVCGAPQLTFNTINDILKELESYGDYESLKVKQMLSEHPIEDFQNALFTLVSTNKKSTLAVTADGDIINVLNLDSDNRGFVSRALKLAIDNGGIKMDCYNLNIDDNNPINLPYIYSKEGFIPATQTPYNNDFVDERIRDNFDKQNGNNGIMFMMYSGENRPLFATYNQMKNFIKGEGNVLTFDDWDDAANARLKTKVKSFEDKLFKQFNMDSQGEMLTKNAYNFFKQSKARNEYGYLVPVYHGSTEAGFTKFGTAYNYYSSKASVSKTYYEYSFINKDANHRPYKSNELLSFDELQGKLDELSEETGKHYEIIDTDYGKKQVVEKDDNGNITKNIASYTDEGYGGWTNLILRTIKSINHSYPNNEVFNNYKVKNLYKGYLNIKNPYIIDAKYHDFDSIFESDKNTLKRLESNKQIVNDVENLSQEYVFNKNWFSKLEELFKKYGIELNVYYGDEDAGEISISPTVKDKWLNADYTINDDEYFIFYKNYGEFSVDSFLEMINNEFGDLNNYGRTNFQTSTDAIASRLAYDENRKYDGVIVKNVNDTINPSEIYNIADDYITFSSNSFKIFDNENPTDDPDIRFSKARDKNAPNNTYKTIETTEDIVSKARSLIETRLGNGYKVSYPKGFKEYSHKALSEINSTKSYSSEAQKLTDMFLNSKIKALNEDTKSFEVIDSLKNILTGLEKYNLKRSIENIIRAGANETAKSSATRSLEIALNKISDISKEYSNRLENIRIDADLRQKFKSQLNANYQITEDNITRDGLAFLMKPFSELHGSSKGFSKKNFAANINEVLSWYNETKINENNYPNLPYYDELRNKLEELYDSLGEPVVQKMHLKNGTIKEREIFGSLSAHSLQLTKEAMRMIYYANKEAVNRYVMESAPSARQTYYAIEESSYGKKGNKFAELFRSYKRGFAPAYTVIREILGGSSAASYTFTTEYQNAYNKFVMYEGQYSDLINKKLKDFGIKEKLDKTQEFYGVNMTMDDLMGLYISLNVEANKNAISSYGVQVYDAKTDKLKTIAESGKANQMKADIENALPQAYKDMANWLLETMNDSIKSDYISWYETRFGKYNHRNEIGDIKENKYWMLNRSYQHLTNVEKVLKAPNGVFSHAKARTNNNNRVLLNGALSGFTAYVNQLGKEIYTKPIYRKGLSILNTKIGAGGKTITELIKTKLGDKDLAYLQNTTEDMLGVRNEKGRDLLSQLMSRFSVAKLSLNIGTMMKQFASIWTSNIPLRQSAKAFISKLTQRADMKAEFNDLLNGENGLGGLKYRKNNATVVRANADGLRGLSEKIAEKGMVGISAVDYFTIGTGVYSLMYIGENQFGYKIGSEENKQFVKDNWSDFELTQIGNSALSKNAVARGEYSDVVKAVFGFMQGANRAALGSQIDKINLYLRNKNASITDLQNQLKIDKAEFDTAKENYELEDSEENREAYIEAKYKVVNDEMRIKDYNRFKVAGGKTIPVNMVFGLAMQGVYVALITELMKHIKGKKDWDDWDAAEIAGDIGLATAVDWIPMLNAFSSMIKGYEVSVPSVEMLNYLTTIISNAKDGNWESMAKQIAILLGDSLGVPVETIYSYIYGAIKTFNPEIAWEMNSFTYNLSQHTATSNLNEYAKEGKTSKVQTMVGIIIDKYKYEGASDNVKNEISNLYMSGYNALPKNYMTEYTNDNGKVITLDANQVKQFKEVYARSDKAVRELMSVTDYSTKTQEEKSKLIKKVYDYYYEYAKCKVVGNKASNKIANLLYYSNGNIGIAKYVSILDKISSITDNGKKTRKELVIEYINKLTGISKQEKLLVMYLAGYSVKDNNLTSLKSYLTSKGISNNNLKDFLGQ